MKVLCIAGSLVVSTAIAQGVAIEKKQQHNNEEDASSPRRREAADHRIIDSMLLSHAYFNPGDDYLPPIESFPSRLLITEPRVEDPLEEEDEEQQHDADVGILNDELKMSETQRIDMRLLESSEMCSWEECICDDYDLDTGTGLIDCNFPRDCDTKRIQEGYCIDASLTQTMENATIVAQEFCYTVLSEQDVDDEDNTSSGTMCIKEYLFGGEEQFEIASLLGETCKISVDGQECSSCSLNPQEGVDFTCLALDCTNTCLDLKWDTCKGYPDFNELLKCMDGGVGVGFHAATSGWMISLAFLLSYIFLS